MEENVETVTSKSNTEHTDNQHTAKSPYKDAQGSSNKGNEADPEGDSQDKRPQRSKKRRLMSCKDKSLSLKAKCIKTSTEIMDVTENAGEMDHQVVDELTSSNVKAIIYNVVKNAEVQEMLENSLQEDKLKLKPSVYEPKMTRARMKEVLQKEGDVPLPWSPWKQGKSRPRRPTFTDLEFAEDDDDDEYNPEAELYADSSALASDDEESTMSSYMSDFGSPYVSESQSPSTAGQASLYIPSLSAKHDNLPQTFASPSRPSASFLQNLDKLDLKASVASRTRSRRPLTHTTIDTLEADFVPPDITPDMYGGGEGDEDPEWKGFLAALFKSDGAVERDEEDDPEADPEYNVLADNEEDGDDDTIPLRVPKTELAQLLEELYEEENIDTEVEEDLTQTFNKPAPICHAETSGKVARVILGELRSADTSSKESQKSEVGWNMLILPNSDEQNQIRIQMQKHVQLLTQHALIADTTCPKHKAQSLQYLNELDLFAKIAAVSGKERTHFSPVNLKQALSISTNYTYQPEESPPNQSDKVKRRGRPQKSSFYTAPLKQGGTTPDTATVSGETTHATPTPASEPSNPSPEINQKALTLVEMNLFTNSPVFIYPQLLPEERFEPDTVWADRRGRARFRPAEDMLITLGLWEFHQRYREFYKLISELMMPVHSFSSIRERVRNSRRKNMDRENPIYRYSHYNEYPPAVVASRDRKMQTFSAPAVRKLPSDGMIKYWPRWLKAVLENRDKLAKDLEQNQVCGPSKICLPQLVRSHPSKSTAFIINVTPATLLSTTPASFASSTPSSLPTDGLPGNCRVSSGTPQYGFIQPQMSVVKAQTSPATPGVCFTTQPKSCEPQASPGTPGVCFTTQANSCEPQASPATPGVCFTTQANSCEPQDSRDAGLGSIHIEEQIVYHADVESLNADVTYEQPRGPATIASAEDIQPEIIDQIVETQLSESNKISQAETTTLAEIEASPQTTTLAEIETSPQTTTLAEIETSPQTTTLAEIETSPQTTTLAEIEASPQTTTLAEIETSPQTTIIAGIEASFPTEVVTEVEASPHTDIVTEIEVSPLRKPSTAAGVRKSAAAGVCQSDAAESQVPVSEDDHRDSTPAEAPTQNSPALPQPAAQHTVQILQITNPGSETAVRAPDIISVISELSRVMSAAQENPILIMKTPEKAARSPIKRSTPSRLTRIFCSPHKSPVRLPEPLPKRQSEKHKQLREKVRSIIPKSFTPTVFQSSPSKLTAKAISERALSIATRKHPPPQNPTVIGSTATGSVDKVKVNTRRTSKRKAPASSAAADFDELDELIEASSTVKNKASKKYRYFACLAPDLIESDPKKTERDDLMSCWFLSQAQEKLGEASDEYLVFLEALLLFGKEKRNPAEFYNELKTGVLSDHPDLLTAFSSFLLPAQAVACGLECYRSCVQFNNGRRFLRKLEVYFGPNSPTFQRLLKIFSKSENTDTLRRKVTEILQRHPGLLDDFNGFFSDSAPPKRHASDYETVDLTEMDEEMTPDGYETMELLDSEESNATKKCKCNCHIASDATEEFREKNKHCIKCKVAVMHSRLYMHTSRGLRRAYVTFTEDGITSVDRLESVIAMCGEVDHVTSESEESASDEPCDSPQLVEALDNEPDRTEVINEPDRTEVINKKWLRHEDHAILETVQESGDTLTLSPAAFIRISNRLKGRTPQDVEKRYGDLMVLLGNELIDSD